MYARQMSDRQCLPAPARPPRLACLALVGVGLLFFGAVGCGRPAAPDPIVPAKSPVSEAPQRDQPSVFRQAIDQAKGLEKKINDRAIDPGENARLGGPDPTGQNQDQ
jgi:hypothetical protein